MQDEAEQVESGTNRASYRDRISSLGDPKPLTDGRRYLPNSAQAISPVHVTTATATRNGNPSSLDQRVSRDVAA